MFSTFEFVCLTAIFSRIAAVDYANNPSVQLLQEYIRFNTTTFNDLGPTVKFWKRLAAAQNVTLKKYVFKKGMPVLVIKWPGTDPTLNSVMLNSHMDVVPANEADGWTYPPFSGQLSDDGYIYGRGSQDMKSVAIQYIEALKRLKAKGTDFLRNVYMTLVPDEEVGDEFGMVPLLASKQFKAMNVGVALDEGGPTPLPAIGVIYQDKVVWQIRVDCHGEAAHGSTFPPTNTTATGKCNKVINNMFAFRDEQYQLAQTAPLTDAGVYTSVNLNKLSGGTANNVIPNLVSLTFDIRLNTRLNEDSFQKKLESMIKEAGESIDITYILKDHQSPATIANSSNPYWNIIASTAANLNLTVIPAIPSGATDSRYIRAAGIPSFGVSPMPSTPFLLHAVNERLSAETFLKGIDFYENLIKGLANLPGSMTGAPNTYVYSTALDE